MQAIKKARLVISTLFPILFFKLNYLFILLYNIVLEHMYTHGGFKSMYGKTNTMFPILKQSQKTRKWHFH